jgi:hypothetical protein
LSIYLPTEIRKNIAIINGVPWGFGKFHPYSFDGLSVEEKIQHIRKAQSFFKDLVPPGLTGSMWLLQKEQSWDFELEQVMKSSPEENQQELKNLGQNDGRGKIFC